MDVADESLRTQVRRVAYDAAAPASASAAGAPAIHMPRPVYDALPLDRTVPLYGWVHENGVSIAYGPETDGGTCIGYSAPRIAAGHAARGGHMRATAIVDPTTGDAWYIPQGPEERAYPAILDFYEVEACFERNYGLVASDAIAHRRVLLVGAGSVGSDVACDLVRQGVRDLTIIDPDTVDPVNMSRTALDRSDIGAPKAFALRRRLARFNPEATIVAFPNRVEDASVGFESLVARADVVVCAADSQVTRRFVNGVCVALGVPLVLIGFHERAEACDVIWVASPLTACLGCIHPTEAEDPAARPDIPYATTEANTLSNGLVSDIKLGNAIGSSLALAFADPGGAGRADALDPRHNRLLIHSGRVPRGVFATVFGGPFQIVGFTHERVPECPHCGDHADARAYRDRVRELAGAWTPPPQFEEWR